MIYVTHGQTETGQILLGCSHAIPPVHAFSGGDGQGPLVIELSQPFSACVAFAISNRQVVGWCATCYQSFGRQNVAELTRAGRNGGKGPGGGLDPRGL
jgi:hypothetical protein